MSDAPNAAPEPVATTDTVAMLCAELRQVRGIPPDATADVIWCNLEKPLSALCFSGGGIRSASFNLGVARALAKYGLLGKFDYLSTVSGGGYIGSWLQVLIKEQLKERPQATHAARIAVAQMKLLDPHSVELRALRDFGNFLTPRVGLGSPDTWAAVVLYLRNLLLNWLVLVPVFLLAVLGPIFHRTATWQAGLSGGLTYILVALAWIGLCWGVCHACQALPSHQSDDEFGKKEKSKAAITTIVVAALVWAMVAPVLLQHLAAGTSPPGGAGPPYDISKAEGWTLLLLWAPLPLLQAAAMLVGYAIAWASSYRRDKPDRADQDLYRKNLARWCVATLGASALLAVAVWCFLPVLARQQGDTTLLTQLGPIALVLIFVVHASFYIGLRREAPRADLDREWLARLDGTILAVATGWSIFAFACVSLGPILSNYAGLDLQGTTGGVTAAGAVASGGLAAWIAKQAKSWAPEVTKNPTIKQRFYVALPTLLSVGFLLGLLAVLGMLVQNALGNGLTWLLNALSVTNEILMPPVARAEPAVACLADQIRAWWAGVGHCPAPLPVAVPPPDRLPAGWLHVVAQILFGLVLWGLIARLRHININRFSMHGAYRNRLVRAFLGSPRAQRRPEWATDFDDADNIRLAALRATDSGPQGLFPVINLALNRSSGGPTGRAERMAASYTATPLHCGSEELDEQNPSHGFVATHDYAGMYSRQQQSGKLMGSDDPGGISLGSVMAASGAAASPHWGYHTSTLTAFIMTLFNVRLGLWLPNPAVLALTDPALRLNRPPHAIRALLGDLIGRTTLESQAIYLSDGGHFDNLGLYEMLRRRCKQIVVVDAGADPGCEFFDLGMAIRRAEIDLPVRVTMRDMCIHSRVRIESDQDRARKVTALGVAVGEIAYLDAPAETGALPEADAELDAWRRKPGVGYLIYIKPSFLPDIPAAARSYGQEHKTFPHEDTADQFFSESQFESYHVLGWFQSNMIAKGASTLDELIVAAARHCGVELFDDEYTG